MFDHHRQRAGVMSLYANHRTARRQQVGHRHETKSIVSVAQHLGERVDEILAIEGFWIRCMAKAVVEQNHGTGPQFIADTPREVTGGCDVPIVDRRAPVDELVPGYSRCEPCPSRLVAIGRPVQFRRSTDRPFRAADVLHLRAESVHGL